MSRMGELADQYQRLLALRNGPPYQPHSPTSIAAAQAIKLISGNKRQAVYDYILSRGVAGATDEEQQTALGMNPSTQRPRRVELWQAGLVYDTGTRRLTKAGRSAVVWFAREKP